MNRKKCADCQGYNISSFGANRNNKGRIVDYYFFCKDCKSENIFNNPSFGKNI